MRMIASSGPMLRRSPPTVALLGYRTENYAHGHFPKLREPESENQARVQRRTSARA
jgi:hypothetical protein